MTAIVLTATGRGDLDLHERPAPEPGRGPLRLRVRACGAVHILAQVAKANGRDGHDVLARAARTRFETSVTRYPLEDANRALSNVRAGRLQGAAVMTP